MARILLSLRDDKTLQKVREALAATRHEVVGLDEPASAEASPDQMAAAIMAGAPDVAVVDYQPEDAASVKLMQTITDLNNRPEFIFIETDESTEREQVLSLIHI